MGLAVSVPVFDFARTASLAVPLGLACGPTLACLVSDSSAVVLIVVFAVGDHFHHNSSILGPCLLVSFWWR